MDGRVRLTIAVCLLSTLVSHGSGQQTAQRVMLEELLEDYDINEWPHADVAEPTDVSVQLFINSFGSLNAANMDYTIDVFLRQRWEDPRLAFNFTRDTVTIGNKEMQAKIWKPDTFFTNVKSANIHGVTMPNVLLRIDNTGEVLYSIRLTLTLACHMDLAMYPFDMQVCDTSLASYANTEDVINYEWMAEQPIDLPDNLEIAQFDLVNYTTEDRTDEFVTGRFSGLVVYFNLRRQSGYHALQTYVPTILIVAISWVSFWLDPNAVPGRVTLGVTTLLTLTTLASGIRASLPPVSYVKAIDVWIGTCMIMVFGALLEFTLANWLANKKILDHRPHMFKIPKLSRNVVTPSHDPQQKQEAENGGDDSTKKPPQTYMIHARALDRVCRVFFPSAFLLFNLVYWPFYLAQQYDVIRDLL